MTTAFLYDGNGDTQIVADLTLDGFDVGLDLQGNENYVNVNQVFFTECVVGVHTYPGQASITNCVFESCVTWGIYLETPSGGVIANNQFYFNGSNGALDEGDIRIDEIDALAVVGNYSNSNGVFLYLLGFAEASIIAGNTVTRGDYGIVVDSNGQGLWGLTISANDIEADYSALLFDDSSGDYDRVNTITGNSFQEGYDGNHVNARIHMTGNAFSYGIVFDAGCVGLAANNTFGDDNWTGPNDGLTDNSGGTVDFGAGNFVNGVWTGGTTGAGGTLAVDLARLNTLTAMRLV
jgi:hypothetical protein